ncbi:MAG: FMN-binding negative transcriptional regulator [Paracoccaceae bacterium]
MHPNPTFRPDDQSAAWELVKERGFGILTVTGPKGILASHVPFVVEGEARIAAHLVRSNPIVPALKRGAADALLIVSGPDGYISPDWYLVADQVPTWNYVAVHIRGSMRLLDDDALLPHLETLSAHNEDRLEPKKPWTHHKMSEGVMERMMRQIVPVEMDVDEISSTWKLNQNKSEDARTAASQAVERSPIAAGASALAKLMREPPQS